MPQALSDITFHNVADQSYPLYLVGTRGLVVRVTGSNSKGLGSDPNCWSPVKVFDIVTCYIDTLTYIIYVCSRLS